VGAQARLLAAVAAGGALGSAARHGLDLALPQPWATVVVNVSGCLLIGALVARHRHAALLRAFLGTGVLGGYTTFSTASADTPRAPRGRGGGPGGAPRGRHGGDVHGRGPARPAPGSRR
jgi:CrcB protein